jgi:hypothetical protein
VTGILLAFDLSKAGRVGEGQRWEPQPLGLKGLEALDAKRDTNKRLRDPRVGAGKGGKGHQMQDLGTQVSRHTLRCKLPGRM